MNFEAYDIFFKRTCGIRRWKWCNFFQASAAVLHRRITWQLLIFHQTCCDDSKLSPGNMIEIFRERPSPESWLIVKKFNQLSGGQLCGTHPPWCRGRPQSFPASDVVEATGTHFSWWHEIGQSPKFSMFYRICYSDLHVNQKNIGEMINLQVQIAHAVKKNDWILLLTDQKTPKDCKKIKTFIATIKRVEGWEYLFSARFQYFSYYC